MATDYPVTMAIRVLRQRKVNFTPHLYTWEPRGGTLASSEHLVDEHAVVKTLIFEDDAKRPLCILMHGDREVSAKDLAPAWPQECGTVRCGSWRSPFRLPGGSSSTEARAVSLSASIRTIWCA